MNPPPQGPERSPEQQHERSARYVLGVLVIVYILNFLDRQILSILAERIKADLGVSDAQMGYLYGTAFAVFFALFGIPLGRLADVWSRTRLIAWGLAAWSTMTTLSGFARNFTHLALARVGVGIGEASASPAAYSLLADYFPKARRATALAIYSSGIYLGSGEGQLDYNNLLASNPAGWKAETRTVDGGAWARHALATMTAVREIEQEPHLAMSHVAAEFGCRGPAFNCMTACAASTQAIGEASEIIRRGDAEAMLAGGAHSMIHLLGMTGFIRLTAMSQRRETPTTAPRPFDQTRDGFVMGEGAGILVLESLEAAQARGATILAEVAGYGSTADAFRITDIQPEGRGAAMAMNQALRQAGVSPRELGPDGRPQVQYISAHGTGTKENDKIESAAVKAVFGPLAGKVPFSSVKSMFGHLDPSVLGAPLPPQLAADDEDDDDPEFGK